MTKNILLFLFFITAGYIISITGSGCAQIGMPTGGPKDTIPPVLVKAVPENNTLNFSGNKITLTFDEYIQLKDIQSNLLVSPLPKSNPSVNYNLKTVTIKLRDTLKPDMTYSLDFGNAIADNNEGNPYKNFTYTFSTGNTIDSLEQGGKVQLAETGKTDSTLIILLYRNAPDSAVANVKPDYITRVKGDGSFSFTHLPPGIFKIYALKDGDGNRYYNSKEEMFAFLDSAIEIKQNNVPVTLYAYAEEKPKPSPSSPAPPKAPEKKLKYNTTLSGGRQDLLSPLEIIFNTAIKNIDSTKLVLTDTNFNPIKNTSLTLDSTRKKLTLAMKWQPEMPLILTIFKEALTDSLGNSLAKSDTIRFFTKAEADYGRAVLRFKNLDQSRHPVLQFLEYDNVKYSFPVTGSEWANKIFPPGDYEIRIYYDDNNNGKWDPGSYTEKRQPEKAISVKQKLPVKADWDNERDIEL